MRKLLCWTLIAIFAVCAAGCDSTDDSLSGAEVFPGNWTVTRINVNGQDFTANLLTLAQLNGVRAAFEANNRFVMFLDSDEEVREIQGSYVLEENQKVLTLTSESFTAPVALGYNIDSENRLRLSSTNGAFLAELAGFDPNILQISSVELVLQRAGT